MVFQTLKSGITKKEKKKESISIVSCLTNCLFNMQTLSSSRTPTLEIIHENTRNVHFGFGDQNYVCSND